MTHALTITDEATRAAYCEDCDFTADSSLYSQNANAAHRHVTETFDGQSFAREVLVTDVVAYDVISYTTATVKVRRRKTDKVQESLLLGGPFPVVVYATVSDTREQVRTLRRRKDGTFRVADWANPLQFTDEEPTTRVDFRH